MILTKEQVEELKRDAWELKYPEAKELIESHEALRSALDIAMGALRFYTEHPEGADSCECGFYEEAASDSNPDGYNYCVLCRAHEALAQLEKCLNEGETK
jgi:hypothetical protein